MKLIFRKWWSNESKVFDIINYKQEWKANGNPPQFKIRTNKYNDFLDITIIIGYLVFNYVNFKLQGDE